jgi:prophage maintenance system killer protein
MSMIDPLHHPEAQSDNPPANPPAVTVATDTDGGAGLAQTMARYSKTFSWLQQYDEGFLNEAPGTPGGSLSPIKQVREDLTGLKSILMSAGEATELFAKDRGDGIEALLGNLDQSVFGEPAYPTIEAKAAHLLYFAVKNHPFSDGNKRSGAYLFVDYLSRNGKLLKADGEPKINDAGLAALTILVAESKPDQKSVIVNLITHMIA